MKECSICHKIKPLNKFSKNKKMKDGFALVCKSCRNLARIKNKKYINQYRTKRRARDIQYRLCNKIRRNLNQAVQYNWLTGETIENLGCSIEDFKKYIESLFKPGMTWENHSYFGWNFDHIIPLGAFDLTNQEQLREATHFTNIQPIWREENIKKAHTTDKIIKELNTIAQS